MVIFINTPLSTDASGAKSIVVSTFGTGGDAMAGLGSSNVRGATTRGAGSGGGGATGGAHCKADADEKV